MSSKTTRIGKCSFKTTFIERHSTTIRRFVELKSFNKNSISGNPTSLPPIPSLSQNSSFLPSGQFGQYLKNIDNIGQLKYSFDVRKISKTDANGNGINPDAFFDTPEAALGEIKLEFIDVLSSNPNGFLEIMSNNLKVSLGIQDVDDLINNIPLIVNKIVKVE